MSLKMLAKKPAVEVEVSHHIEPEVVPHQKVLVVEPEVSKVEALTTEYIELYRKFVYFEVKDMVQRMEEIRKELQSIANETWNDNQIGVFTSTEGEIEFSERGKIATVPQPLVLIQELLTKFGPVVTMSVVDIAITPLRKVLSEFELKKYLKDEPGSRRLKSVRPVK